jgi:hypothetical protein
MAPYRRVLAGDTGHLVSPTELMAVEEPGQLYFVEPLARRIESGVVASMQELRRLRQQAASLRHELELATESLERERVNSAAIDDDRRRLDVHLSTLRRHPSRDEAMRSLAATLLACEREAVSAQNGKTIEADRLTAELSWARERLQSHPKGLRRSARPSTACEARSQRSSDLLLTGPWSRYDALPAWSVNTHVRNRLRLSNT